MAQAQNGGQLREVNPRKKLAIFFFFFFFFTTKFILTEGKDETFFYSFKASLKTFKIEYDLLSFPFPIYERKKKIPTLVPTT